MGWLWGSGGDATSSKSSKDGAYVAPDRTKRVMCWDSRDEYFQCLNRNNILDALKEQDAAAKACGKETQAFEENCASSWIRRSFVKSDYNAMSFGQTRISISQDFAHDIDMLYRLADGDPRRWMPTHHLHESHKSGQRQQHAASPHAYKSGGNQADHRSQQVKYFKQRRVAEYEKEQLLKKQAENANQLPTRR